MPSGPFVEARHPLGTTPEEREAFEDALEREGTLTRRRLLIGGMSGALVALGVAFLFPIRSLGPSPGNTLGRTPWRKGLRAVTDDGRPVRASEVPVDGLVTIFPQGHPGSADGQVVLMRVDPDALDLPAGPRDVDARRARSATRRSARTPAVRSACTRRSATSCCARVTSPRSTC